MKMTMLYCNQPGIHQIVAKQCPCEVGQAYEGELPITVLKMLAFSPTILFFPLDR